MATHVWDTGHLLVSAPPGTHRLLHRSGRSLSFSETNEGVTPERSKVKNVSFGLCFPIPVAK